METYSDIQKNVMSIEKIQNAEQRIKIIDNINNDIFIINRRDIRGFSYPKDSQNAYIDFVLPFVNGLEMKYHTFSRKKPIVKSGEILSNFCIDKDVNICPVNICLDCTHCSANTLNEFDQVFCKKYLTYVNCYYCCDKFIQKNID